MSMKFLGVRRSALAAASAVVAISAGCEKTAAPVVRPSVNVQAASLGPEESFKVVVDTFRRGMEGLPIGFRMQDESGGLSMMTAQNEVSYELIRPEKAGNPYKGIVTVRIETRYSMQRPTESPEPTEDENEQKKNITLPEDEGDAEVFDSELVSTPGKGSRTKATATDELAPALARKADTHERKYELVYDNGRWKLTTKLDPKTEKSVQQAFDRALEQQS
jgi:hypothetical protein